MTFQQLSYLLEVHKAGSFSKAAKNLYITQSAVSNAISGLEKEIGTPIFIRSQYGLTPTPRGEEVISHAARICESMHFLTTEKEAHKKAVRIGCGSYLPVANAFIRLLKENQNRTDIEFSLRDSRAGSYIKCLLNFEMDIAFYFKFNTYSQGTRKDIEQQGLCYEELAAVPAVVCIGPGHPLYNQPVVHMRDLRNHKLMDSSKTGVCNAKTLSAYLPASKDNMVIACGQTVRRRILEEGLAYQIMHMPGKTERIEGFRYIPIDGLSYTFYCVTNPKHPRSAEVDRFLELLKEEISLEYGDNIDKCQPVIE